MSEWVDEASRRDDLSPRCVMSAAREAQRSMRLAEVRLLELAAQWAVLHPAEAADSEDAAVFFDRRSGYQEPIAAAGCPSVREDSVDEFAAAIGTSSDAAKRLIGSAIQLQHRLPRSWARLRTGEVEVWRARLIAHETIHQLTGPYAREAAAWVDAQLAPLLGRVGAKKIRQVVEAAWLHFEHLDPAQDPSDPGRDETHVTIDFGAVSERGTVLLHAELRLADALDLASALESGAAALTSDDPDLPPVGLAARRARALGDLARRSTGLPTARRLEILLHFNAPEVAGQVGAPDELQVCPVGGMENGNRIVLMDWVKNWAADSFTDVRVRPVLDLTTELNATGYAPSPLLREQAITRDAQCVFPWCPRSARRCDLDHCEPFDSGRPAVEQTRSGNLAPLCRRHHRRKTHTPWAYRHLAPGIYEWTSPQGLTYLRGPFGTVSLT